jgi:hypothetical protein
MKALENVWNAEILHTGKATIEAFCGLAGRSKIPFRKATLCPSLQ